MTMGFFGNLFNRPPKPGKPRPVTDASFEQDVLNSDLPVVIDFWSPTCAPCQVMAGLLNEIGPDYAGRINIFKLNVIQNPETAARFQVRSVPTVVFMKGETVVDTVVGLLPLLPLREKMDQLARR
jgi:thioredoxin 1